MAHSKQTHHILENVNLCFLPQQNFRMNVLNGTTFNSKSKIKYLGSVIDRSLSGQDNLSTITNKSNSKLKFVYRHKRVLSTSTGTILSTSLIQGYFDYASVSLFFSFNSSLQHKLQVVQNNVVRFILNKGAHWQAHI